MSIHETECFYCYVKIRTLQNDVSQRNKPIHQFVSDSGLVTAGQDRTDVIRHPDDQTMSAVLHRVLQHRGHPHKDRYSYRSRSTHGNGRIMMDDCQ